MCGLKTDPAAKPARACPDFSKFGSHDVVFFDTSKTAVGQDVGRQLEFLGGIRAAGATRVFEPERVVSEVEPPYVDKSPVYLTEDTVPLVHEPASQEGTVPIDASESKMLKSVGEWPEVIPQWDGEWHGSEASRLAYLREHSHLWGFTHPSRVRRRTSVFFVKKKDGQLRKILSCVNFNRVCVEPPSCCLPGSWNITKIRFRKRRFFSSESDVSAFYSRLQTPEWIKYFLCLSDVLIDDILDMSNGRVFECPYTRECFRSGDVVAPCWPRVPMGWSWSVVLAVEAANQIMAKSISSSCASLNIPKNSFLRTADVYTGSYIDNLFCLGESAEEVNAVQRQIDQAFIDAGLPLSTQSEAAEQRKLLGLQLGDGAVRCPDSYPEEMLHVSQRKYVPFWQFEKCMGKSAWLFPLRRRMFSVLFSSYELLAKKRRKETKSQVLIRLPQKVRAEFECVAKLSHFLAAELRMAPADSVFACDASLQGWAITELQSGGGFIPDSGLSETPFETQLLRSDRWRLRKQRRFRKRLSHVLPGEICGFRQACTMGAKKFKGCDLLVYTDNSNVFHAVRKGRSGSLKLNALCKHILLLELVFKVKVHPRWCSTHSMPADRYTRWESDEPRNV